MSLPVSLNVAWISAFGSLITEPFVGTHDVTVGGSVSRVAKTARAFDVSWLPVRSMAPDTNAVKRPSSGSGALGVNTATFGLDSVVVPATAAPATFVTAMTFARFVDAIGSLNVAVIVVVPGTWIEPSTGVTETTYGAVVSRVAKWLVTVCRR